jgi:hypothetical protein
MASERLSPARKGVLKGQALRFANKIRKELGLKPVDHLYPGNPNDGNSCPITNTIYDDDLDKNRFKVDTGLFGIKVSEKVLETEGYPYTKWLTVLEREHWPSSKEFVAYFDAYKIPELSIKPVDEEIL